MRIAVLAVVATIAMAATGWCDDMDHTFQKVDKYLYGTDGGQPVQQPTRTPPQRQRAVEPAPEYPATEQAPAAVPSGGITWDFETGDLRGWTATGTVFNNQPTYGDNPTERHRGQPSHHQGNFWIGGYENRPTHRHLAGATQGDGPQGTLTSAAFVIQGSAISFLIGGGCDLEKVRVELLVDGQVVDRATGKCTETMARDSFPVERYRGRTAQIRLIDYSSGGWGHINFDDVRFE